MYLDSGTNSGMIGLGTDGSAVTYGTTGVYLDGTGKFSAATTNGYGIFWDTSTLRVSSSEFYLGDATNFISGSGGAISIGADTFDLLTSTQHISSSGGGVIAMGKTIPTELDDGGIFLSGSGEFNLQRDANNYLRYTKTGGLDIRSQNFDLLTSTQHISSSNGGIIAMGTTIPTELDDNGIMLSGSGEFNLQSDSNNYIRQDGGSFSIKADTFDLSTTYLRITDTAVASALAQGIVISGASKHILVGSQIAIEGDGDSNYGSITIGSKVILRGNSDSTISGWTVGSSTLESVNDKVILDSTADGKIRLGATPPESATSGTGIFLGGDGDFLAGSSAGNHFQFLSGGTLDIDSAVFSLNATTILIDSATNDGKIALGDTPPTSVDYTSNAGIYMDGTGDFLARGDNDNFIKKDGTSLSISSETFDLDAGTIVMDSELNSGTLRLGESGGPTSNAAGQERAGIYMDGTGDLLISDGDAGDNEGYLKFDSSGTFELQTPALTFETDGTITSQDYLIEKTRIFGSGGDGDAVLSTDGATPITSDDDGSNLFTRSGAVWTQQQDVYMEDLTINVNTYLESNGYRIFVRGILNNNGWIRNDGHGGTAGIANAAGSGGDGGHGGSLAAGTDGSGGGRGGWEQGGTHGGGGGGAGGTGGTIFISARTLAGIGGIRVVGGAGGAGGTLLP
jgi:hypothetical protein